MNTASTVHRSAMIWDRGIVRHVRARHSSLFSSFAACHAAPKNRRAKSSVKPATSDTECLSCTLLAESRARPRFAPRLHAAIATASPAEQPASVASGAADTSLCTAPSGDTCRQPLLGDICSGSGDPFCARTGPHLHEWSTACARFAPSRVRRPRDCSAVTNAECTTVAGTAWCVPPDPDTIAGQRLRRRQRRCPRRANLPILQQQRHQSHRPRHPVLGPRARHGAGVQRVHASLGSMRPRFL